MPKNRRKGYVEPITFSEISEEVFKPSLLLGCGLLSIALMWVFCG